MGLKLIQKIDKSGIITTVSTAKSVGDNKSQASFVSRLAKGPSFLGGVASTILHSLNIGKVKF